MEAQEDRKKINGITAGGASHIEARFPAAPSIEEVHELPLALMGRYPTKKNFNIN